MADKKIVLSGSEHVARLAVTNGYQFWTTLWGENGDLSAKRANELVLFHGDRTGAPGDTVIIPDPAEKQESGAADQHHPNQTGVEKLFLRLLVLDENYKTLPQALFRLTVDGMIIRSIIRNGAVNQLDSDWFEPDADGSIDVLVPTTAQRGRLDVSLPPPPPPPLPPGEQPPDPPPPPAPRIQLQYFLQIGRLNPIQEQAPDEWCIAGVQQRLNNLGFDAGMVDGIYGPSTGAALKRFQARCNIQESESTVATFKTYIDGRRQAVQPPVPLDANNAAPPSLPPQHSSAVQQPPPTDAQQPPQPAPETQVDVLYPPGPLTQAALFKYHDSGEPMPKIVAPSETTTAPLTTDAPTTPGAPPEQETAAQDTPEEEDTTNYSGPHWLAWADENAPDSKSVDDLQPPFKANVQAFLDALREAGAQVEIVLTKRDPKRAYLCYWAYKIARVPTVAAKADPMQGVPITWNHDDDVQASGSAAAEMVRAFGIESGPRSHMPPALDDNHQRGFAIDLRIAWHGRLSIKRADQSVATIAAPPWDGANPELHKVGATYSLLKATTDDVHWVKK